MFTYYVTVRFQSEKSFSHRELVNLFQEHWNQSSISVDGDVVEVISTGKEERKNES